MFGRQEWLKRVAVRKTAAWSPRLKQLASKMRITSVVWMSLAEKEEWSGQESCM